MAMMLKTRGTARNPKRGIALLITVIFMSVMLAFGLALAALAYKQSVLASTATQSQVAFYAADSILECALFVDQGDSVVDLSYTGYSSTNQPSPAALTNAIAHTCDGTVVAAPTLIPPSPTATWTSGTDGRLTIFARVALNNNATCADITIYKYGVARTDGRKAYLFATSYNVPCSGLSSGGRIVVRGIDQRY